MRSTTSLTLLPLIAQSNVEKHLAAHTIGTGNSIDSAQLANELSDHLIDWLLKAWPQCHSGFGMNVTSQFDAPPSVNSYTEAQVRAVHGAYEVVWLDFLKNRKSQAAQKAAAFLCILENVPASRKDAELWAVEADFWYVVGAANGDEPTALQNAVRAYNKTLTSNGGWVNSKARHMLAETLLRLWRYEEAFRAFDELSTLRPDDTEWQRLEAAPFRLRHDAALVERLAKLGRLDALRGKEIAIALRDVAARVDARTSNASEIARPCIYDLPPEDTYLLRIARFDGLCQEVPYPAERLRGWASASSPPVLNPHIDWPNVQLEYLNHGIVVVDDFFSADALEELWAYALESPSFRTSRKGFLGAFPADGFTHPLIHGAATELKNVLPNILQAHPLGLWWLFKYTSASPSGIGIHADVAAVNLNIWLTPNAGRVSGGGLEIFKKAPPSEASVGEFNREFENPQEEARLRAELEASGVYKVEYKQNRAVIFVSDLFHASEPFEFPDSEKLPRVNLTFLFGDRPHRETFEDRQEKGGVFTERKQSLASQVDTWEVFH